MTKLIFLVALAGALTGCAATGTQIQADCERQFSGISDIVACTKDMLAKKNPGKLQDSKAKLYLLRGEQLAQDVASGKMSNVDARVAWQRLYVELWEPSPQEIAARTQAINQVIQQQQRQAGDSGYKIVTPPTTTVCTSGPYLGQVRTECRSQ